MNRNALAALVCAGFALRLAFALTYWVGKPLMLDEQEYLLLAARAAAGQGYGYPAAPGTAPPARHFERPPAFPLALAVVLRVTGDPLVASARHGDVRLPASSSDIPLAIRIVQALAGALVIPLVAALAGRAAGPRAATIAAVITTFYPPLVWTCAYVLAEPMYSVLAFAAVLLLLRAGGIGEGLAAGAIGGVALLTKEPMLFFLPLAFLWLMTRHRRLAAAGLLIGTVLVTGPWVARNYAVHGRFVLTAAHGGVTLWTGNNPLARGEGDLAANPDMGRARVDFEARHQGATPADLDALYYREAVHFIAQHPVAWLALDARKVFYTFVPIGPSYRLHSQRYYVASLISYALLMPCAIAGLVRLARRGRASALWALWLLAASTVLVCVIFFPQERFRIPILDPTFVVCAAMLWGQVDVAGSARTAASRRPAAAPSAR